MTTQVIGLLHPGEMGCAIGAELVRVGHTVMWASKGRGPETAARAAAAGLVDAGDVDSVVGAAAVVLSICPPHAAEDVARSIPTFDGVYVDANAIAPETSRAVGAVIESHGTAFVDGGIIGRPPMVPDAVRIYLAGGRADDVAALFTDTTIRTPVLDKPVGAASAVKMAYGGWTKGINALLIAIAEYAAAEGVEDTLHEEWLISQPTLPDRLLAARAAADDKGWRWIGEMREIAAALESAGLPRGFHEASASIFEK